MHLELVKPTNDYKKEFQALVWNYISHRETLYMNIYKDALEDFESYVTQLNNHANNIDIPKGWVAYDTYWLIMKENDEVIILGNFRLRHELVDGAGHIGYDIRPDRRGQGYGHKILELGLKKAMKFDFSEVIITCDSINESSKRIIERCNGKLSRTFYDEESKENRLEYLIRLL